MMYNEKALIQQLRDPSQREGAFRILVQEFQEPLYWQIRRMVTNHEDTDDCLQNVFMKAWMALDNFRGDAKLSTWLYRIAVNETLNYIAKQHPSFSLDNNSNDDEDTTLPAYLQLESDPYFDGDETERKLQEAISTLPPKQRQVFNMKYFQEMKYEDISDILGTSIGALKASYHHAVNKVTSFFEKETVY